MSEQTKTELTFHYSGYYDNGEKFYDSAGKDPLTIIAGRGSVMRELEEALLEMNIGETREVFVPLAYGERDKDAVQTRIMKYTIPGGDALEEGMEIMWTSPQNPQNPIPARIIRADEYSFDIDFNHPLAGKDLTYRVELLNRREL